jgi:long-chain-fatty-acid--CoA ligase ACSBG
MVSCIIELIDNISTMSNQTVLNELFKVREDENIYISTPGFEKLMARYEGENGGKDVVWTTDYNLELPIKLKKSGPGSEVPTTLIEEFQRIYTVYPERPALSVKVDGKWVRA